MQPTGSRSVADSASRSPAELDLIRYINLKLAALGERTDPTLVDAPFMEAAGPLLKNHLQKDELLGWPLCPVDARIQRFLSACLANTEPGSPALPARTLVLDRPGIGRVLSLPPRRDRFVSPYLTSYRAAQGLLHNPKSDRRTTQGVFHVVEGGLPVPFDKRAVPKATFARLLALFDGQLLMNRHLRVGFEPGTALWRMFKLRPDFHPADKVQVEDDITDRSAGGGIDAARARLAAALGRAAGPDPEGSPLHDGASSLPVAADA